MNQKKEYTEKKANNFLVFSTLKNLIIPAQSIIFDQVIYTSIDSLLEISSSESSEEISKSLVYLRIFVSLTMYLHSSKNTYR